MEEAQQTLTNLRDRVAHLELELSTTHEHMDALAKDKTWAQERIAGLEQQSQEYLARCKALSSTNEALLQGTNPPHAAQGATEELMRLQQKRLEVEQKKENFEAERVGWVHMEALNIATHTYHLLAINPPTTTKPPQDFLDACIDNALAVLELEHSDHEWESVDADLMSPLQDNNLSSETLDISASPVPLHHGSASTSSPIML